MVLKAPLTSVEAINTISFSYRYLTGCARARARQRLAFAAPPARPRPLCVRLCAVWREDSRALLVSRGPEHSDHGAL